MIKTIAKRFIPSILNPQSPIKSPPSSSFWLYFTLITVSVGLSLLAFFQDPVFNSDGVRYLKAAEAFWQQGFKATFALNSWPFYSVAIAYLAKFTGLSCLKAAYLMNIVFSIGTALLFVKTVKLIDCSPKLLWIAAFVILVCHQFYSYRYDFIRDHGYWFFYLLSLWYLIRFCQNDRWANAIGWSVSLIIAALFRVEGLAFLALAPFCVWLLPDVSLKKRLYLYFQLNIPLIFCGAGLLGAFGYLHTHEAVDLGQLYNFSGRSGTFLNLLSDTQKRLLAIQQYVLIPEARRGALDFFVFGAIGTFLKSIFFTYTLTFTFLTTYAIWRKLIPNKIIYRILIAYWLINFFILVFFFSQALFFASRYVMAIAFIMLYFVPFALRDIYQRWKKRSKNNISSDSWLFPFVCFLLLAMAAGDLYPFGPTKTHLYRAVEWINHHTPQTARICLDNDVLGYLTERPVRYVDFKEDLTKTQAKNPPCDYLLVPSSRDEKNAVQTSPPLKIFFGNHHRDQVFIFKVS